MSDLFQPVKVGRYTAKNRIFMAPMSRYRAPHRGIAPDFTAEYYSQRASAGLIVAESTMINDWSGGINCPGMYNSDQAAAWKNVADAIHANDGLIFLQLWHSGRAAHQSLLPDGRLVSAPSAIGSTAPVITADGMEQPSAPKELSLEEIVQLRADFAAASRFALEAGLDGVEFHAAGGFLIDTFLQSSTNHRTDAYGGAIENRFRFLKEVVEDTIDVWGADRVAVKLSPTSAYNDMGKSDDILETFTYVYSQLDTYGLAFLEVNEEIPFSEPDSEKRAVLDQLRTLWSGVYVANGGYDAEKGNAQIAAGKATAISFGRPFLANPDLPARLKQNGPFNEPNPETFYGGDALGLTDYPFLDATVA